MGNQAAEALKRMRIWKQNSFPSRIASIQRTRSSTTRSITSADSNLQFTMAEKLEAVGRTNGTIWDDGSDHDSVARICVRGGLEGIQYMEFEYVKNEQLKSGVLFGVWHSGFTETFEINHLNDEYLESVEGSYDDATDFIQALQFKTNFRVSEVIGYDKGTKFSLGVTGKKIVGFHGYKTNSATKPNIISLGAYFDWISPCRLEAKGGKGGQQWDDGTDHGNVTKIHVRGGFEGIQYIKIDYIKNGQPKDGLVHGLSGSGFTQTFDIDHLNNEHLVSVEGYYDEDSDIIQSLQFSTNMRNSELLGYEKGTKFSLAGKGKKIIGFHGYAEKNLNSLGAYFTIPPPTKSECKGLSGGITWDDGVFHGISKIYVSYDVYYLRGIKFDYYNGPRVVTRQHGSDTGNGKEFVLDYPNEYITLVKGTIRGCGRTDMRLASLIFQTSKGRISPLFGTVSDRNSVDFVLESKGCALSGFHGQFRQNSTILSAIGAYFSPLPPPPIAEKLQAEGGVGGALWDDGVFDGLRKIYVGRCNNGIAFLKFVYDKDSMVVVGDDHGNKTLLEIREFELEYPSEYITAVEGCYDKVTGSEVEVITMLSFKTNKRTSIPIGFMSGSSFVLHKECYKIVGFHGKASNHMIYQLGVHVVPVTN